MDSLDVDNAVKKLENAIDKACQFLSRNLPQHEDTWLGSSPSGFVLSSNAYMILTQAYQAGGRPQDAAEIVGFYDSQYNSPHERRIDAADPSSVNFGLNSAYHPSFGAISMTQMGRPDLASKLMRQVLPYQGKGALGGFFGGSKEASSGTGVFCFDSSCAAIIACLWTGHVDAARRGGSYLLHLAKVSTADRWYWSIDTSGQPMNSLEHPSFSLNQCNPMQAGHKRFPMHDDRWCFMTKGEDHQAHWKTGFYLACCVYLYRHFDDERFLLAAEQCASFACACRASCGGWRMWSHKLAWGTAELYTVTRNERWLQMSYEIGMMLVDRQCQEGYWKYEEWFPDEASRPIQVMYSIAAQATTWMGKVRDALLSYSRKPRTPPNGQMSRTASSTETQPDSECATPTYSRTALLAAKTQMPTKNTFLHFDDTQVPAAPEGGPARSTTAPPDYCDQGMESPSVPPQPQLCPLRTESVWSRMSEGQCQSSLDRTATAESCFFPQYRPREGAYPDLSQDYYASDPSLDRTATSESCFFPQYRPYTNSVEGSCASYTKPTMQDISVDTSAVTVKNTFIDGWGSPVSTPVSGLQKSTTSPPVYFGQRQNLQRAASRKDSQLEQVLEDEEEVTVPVKKKGGFYETKTLDGKTSNGSKSGPPEDEEEQEPAPEYDAFENLPVLSAGMLRVADDKCTVCWAPKSDQLSRQSAEHQVISPSFALSIAEKQVNFKLMIRPAKTQNRRGVMRAAFKNTQYRQVQLKCLDDPESLLGSSVEATFQVISPSGVDQRVTSYDFQTAICEPTAGDANWEMRPPKAKSGEKPLVIAVRLTSAARPVRF